MSITNVDAVSFQMGFDAASEQTKDLQAKLTIAVNALEAISNKGTFSNRQSDLVAMTTLAEINKIGE